MGDTAAGENSATKIETITHAEMLKRFEAQGVPVKHWAFRCYMCGTVQSPRSFERAGADKEAIERQIGFSCVGRWTGAGGWNPKNKKRRAVPGCDWTLGGLFGGSRLLVKFPDGKQSYAFDIATPAEAQALMARDGEIVPAEVSGE